MKSLVLINGKCRMKNGVRKQTKCTISVFLNERWISKEDGSEESDYSSVKGGFSNSLKRAAVLWGVGRYLV